MAKIKSKGVALLQSISGTYTAITQIKSIDVSGEKSETYDSRTLDQSAAYVPMDINGYVMPCTIKADVWYDPALSAHTAFTGLVATPVATNFKITYTDSGPTSAIYSGTGFGVDKKISPAEGVSATFEIQTSGAPS